MVIFFLVGCRGNTVLPTPDLRQVEPEKPLAIDSPTQDSAGENNQIEAQYVQDGLDDCYDMYTSEHKVCAGPWGDLTEAYVQTDKDGNVQIMIAIWGGFYEFPEDEGISVALEFEGIRRTAVVEFTPEEGCQFTVQDIGSCYTEVTTINMSFNIYDLPDCADCVNISGVRINHVYPFDVSATAFTVDSIPDEGYIPLIFE